MLMYNLIEYSDNSSETLGISWQYYREELALNDADAFTDFPDANNNSALSNFKQKNIDQAGNNGKKMLKKSTIKIFE